MTAKPAEPQITFKKVGENKYVVVNTKGNREIVLSVYPKKKEAGA